MDDDTVVGYTTCGECGPTYLTDLHDDVRELIEKGEHYDPLKEAAANMASVIEDYGPFSSVTTDQWQYILGRLTEAVDQYRQVVGE